MSQFDMGGILVDDSYWDCACKTHYIHSIKRGVCPRCGADRERDDRPPARVDEIGNPKFMALEISKNLDES